MNTPIKQCLFAGWLITTGGPSSGSSPVSLEMAHLGMSSEDVNAAGLDLHPINLRVKLKENDSQNIASGTRLPNFINNSR